MRARNLHQLENHRDQGDDMNLKDGKGKVPIETGSDTHPYVLVALPSREVFPTLYQYKMGDATADKHYDMIRRRATGASLAEVAGAHRVTKEAVRKVEAKFMRIMRLHYLKETSSGIGSQQNRQRADGSR